MMHLCITQCTYWTPLEQVMVCDILKGLLRYLGLCVVRRWAYCPGLSQEL